MNQLDKVIEYLEDWSRELSQKTGFASIEAKAENIGLMNSISVAIDSIKICDKYGIHVTSWFCVFPARVRGVDYPAYRVLCDNDSHLQSDWTEVEFSGRGRVEFRPGDLAIRCGAFQ